MKTKILNIISFCNIIFFVFFLFSFSDRDFSKEVEMGDKIIKVRGVVVVDSLGIERVIIGSSLPTAQSAFGNRLYPREKGSGVSGVMLYDAEGQERGGYVTDDDYGNVFLTLDSKSNQTFLALAEPNGSTAVQLWDRSGRNKVSISTSESQAKVEIKDNNKNLSLYEK